MQASNIALRIAEHPAPFIALFVLWFASWIYSLWHCLSEMKDPARLTWLVVLMGIPFFGVIFYWWIGADERDRLQEFKRLDEI